VPLSIWSSVVCALSAQEYATRSTSVRVRSEALCNATGWNAEAIGALIERAAVDQYDRQSMPSLPRINAAFADRFFGAAIPDDNLTACQPGRCPALGTQALRRSFVVGRSSNVFGQNHGCEWLEYHATYRFTSGASAPTLRGRQRRGAAHPTSVSEGLNPYPMKNVEDQRNYFSWNRRVGRNCVPLDSIARSSVTTIIPTCATF